MHRNDLVNLSSAIDRTKYRMLVVQVTAFELGTLLCLAVLFRKLDHALVNNDPILFDDVLCKWHREYPDVTDLMFDELFSILNIESRDELTTMLGIGQE